MGKGIIFISLALFIDGLQAFLDWAFIAAGGALQELTPLGAGLAGAAAGASACWNSSGNVISGIIDAGKCALIEGAAWGALSTVGMPLGIGLGFAVNFVISATLGVMLITGLALFGFIKKEDWFFVGGMGLCETIPGASSLFWWTTLTTRLVLKNRAQKLVAKITPPITTLATNDNAQPAANDNARLVGQEAYAA